MPRIAGETVIHRPAEVVFDFVADERNTYDPQVRNAELLIGEPIGVGTCFRSEASSWAGPVEMIIEITEYDRPTRLSTTTHLASMDIDSMLAFEPDVGATRLHWTSDVRPRGLLRLLAPVIALHGGRQTRAVWANLKTVLEAQPDHVAKPG